MKFSTTELFKLNLICLNPVKTVSSHKCPDWGKSFSLNQSGLSLSLTNPRTTESTLFWREFHLFNKKVLDHHYLAPGYSICSYASLPVWWSYPWQNFARLTHSGPSHSPCPPSPSGCIKVGAFVEPINLVIFSTVAGSLFTLKAWNSHTVLWSHDIPCRGLAGGLWLMLWSGLEMQNSERAPF